LKSLHQYWLDAKLVRKGIAKQSSNL